MKCPHCKYVSFDFLDVCKKCGKDLIEIKAKHNIVTFRPAFIPTGDAAFNIAFPLSPEAAPQEEPLVEMEEEAAVAPSEAESTMELTIEPTDLTLGEEDMLELEEEAGKPTMAMEEEEGLRLGDETVEGKIDVEDDLGRTLGVEEAMGTETVVSDEQLETGMRMEGMESSREEAQIPPIIGGEPELELDMEAFEVPSILTEEPTPPSGAPLQADIESMEDQAPLQEEKTTAFEQTLKITPSPMEDEEDQEKGTEHTDEGRGMYELEITEEDLLRLDENK